MVRADCEATNCPLARAVQKRWSEAVSSGTQGRNWDGLTPMTLTGRRPALISAPSKAIMFRTPVILSSAVSCWLVSPAGATTSRSGRMICRNEAAFDAAAAAGGAPGGPGCRSPVNAPAPSSTSALQPATPRSASAREREAAVADPASRISRCPINRPIIAIHPNPVSGCFVDALGPSLAGTAGLHKERGRG